MPIIFAASYDPITLGHYDLIQRALKLTDKVYAVIAYNPDKKGFLDFSERKELLELIFQEDSRVEVVLHEGLLIDFCKEKNCYTLLRGLRNSQDFIYERDMAWINSGLEEKIETIFMMTKLEHMPLSSSALKTLISYKKNISAMTLPKVIEYLKQKNKK